MDLTFIWDYDEPSTRPQGILFRQWCSYLPDIGVVEAAITNLRTLIRACEAGDIQKVQALLNEGVSSNLPTQLTAPPYLVSVPSGFRVRSHYYTPLQAATHFNRTDVVRALLAARAEITSDFESLAFLFCMGHPDQDTLDLLLNHGFNIQATARGAYKKDNLLHWACRNGCPTVAIANLIKNGISIRAPDSSLHTPIVIAIAWPGDRDSRRYCQVIRELLSRASHKELRDSHGSYPLHIAVRSQHAELVRIMLRQYGADPNVRDAGGLTPLRLALGSKDLNSDIIRFLLEAGASLDILLGKDWDFETFWPSWRQFPISMETLHIFLDAAVSQSIQSHLPHPFICLAAIVGDAEILKSSLSLCNMDDDANQQKNKDTVFSALSYALDFKNDTCIKVLMPFVLSYDEVAAHIPNILHYYLENGTDERVRGWLGRSECVFFDVLRWKEFVCAAMRHQPPEILSMLLSRSKTPPNISLRLLLLREAMEIGSIQRLSILFEYPPFNELFPAQESIIVHAAGHSRPEVLEFLYDLSTRPDGTDNPTYFPKGPLIQMACRTGNLDNVRWLLESEVVVDVYEGLRPGSRNILLDAVTGGHTEIVELLLAHNIDVNEMDSFTGKTALHFAASGGHEDITRLLLEAGADVHKADSEMKTPLCQAVKEVNNLTSRQIIDRCRNGEAEITAEWFRRLFEPRIQAIWTLVEYGGELSEEWFVPRTLFAGNDTPALLEYMEQDSADDSRARARLSRLAENTGPEIWLQYLERGAAGLDIVDDWGRTLFLRTVERKQMEWSMPEKRELRAVLTILMLAGCDISKADSRGRTPLHIVNAAGDDEMVKLLYAAR